MPYEPRLHARPLPVTGTAPTGLHRLDLGSARESHFYVPPRYDPAQPAPLMLLLHGAGGHSRHGLELMQHFADNNGLILIAPASIAHTWDIIANRSYGPDVFMADQALEHVFGQYAVDPSHLAIGGFSDGASYALSLGLANGDLFTHVVAFSPGFIASVVPWGKPRVFISHGTQDHVLPIEPCSRKIVPQLQQAGYAVLYEEFEGGHAIPAEIAQSALNWFVGRA